MRFVDRSLEPKIRPSVELPSAFRYPEEFLADILAHAGLPSEMAPWVADPGWQSLEPRLAAHLGCPVIPFAFAQLEDTVACFLVEQAEVPRVAVVNPFLHREEAGVWHQDRCVTYEVLSSYSEWVKWVYANEYVHLDRSPNP
jgi:hypothetical protein